MAENERDAKSTLRPLYKEFVALTTRHLDYLARQNPYLEPIFKGVFASDQLPKLKDIQTISVYIVNVDTRDKQGSHWLK